MITISRSALLSELIERLDDAAGAVDRGAMSPDAVGAPCSPSSGVRPAHPRAGGR